MSERTKKHPISAHSHGSMLYISNHQVAYAIPKSVAKKYEIEPSSISKKQRKSESLPSINVIFEKLDEKYTKSGALLKGVRLREGLSQVQFAKKIAVTQANLSAMENGHRSIGKIIAKRIEKFFGVNYRYFLG